MVKISIRRSIFGLYELNIRAGGNRSIKVAVKTN